MFWIIATFDQELSSSDRSQVEDLVWHSNWTQISWTRRYVHGPRPTLQPGELPRPGGAPMVHEYRVVIGLTPNASQEAMDLLVDALRRAPKIREVATRADEPLATVDQTRKSEPNSP